MAKICSINETKPKLTKFWSKKPEGKEGLTGRLFLT
jgi:hypothetical protein